MLTLLALLVISICPFLSFGLVAAVVSVSIVCNNTYTGIVFLAHFFGYFLVLVCSNLLSALTMERYLGYTKNRSSLSFCIKGLSVFLTISILCSIVDTVILAIFFTKKCYVLLSIAQAFLDLAVIICIRKTKNTLIPSLDTIKKDALSNQEENTFSALLHPKNNVK